MGKKKTLKLSSLLLKNTEIIKSSSSSSFWPSCHQPKTLSFRASNKDNTFKTFNSAYLDATMDMLETSESFFTVSPDNSPSFSTTSELEESKKPDSIETVIRGLRSDRLFFEPDESNSILQLNKSSSSSLSSSSAAVDADALGDENGTLVFKDSVVLSMESQDPYVDFRKSMEEMVAAHDVKDWECLQELLCWYLKVNEKSNHGYIVGAFVDLLVGLAFASPSFSSSYSSSTSLSPSSPLSFYSSSISSSCLEVEEEVVQTLPSSSLLLGQVSEEIDHEDEPSASSSRSSSI